MNQIETPITPLATGLHRLGYAFIASATLQYLFWFVVVYAFPEMTGGYLLVTGVAFVISLTPSILLMRAKEWVASALMIVLGIASWWLSTFVSGALVVMSTGRSGAWW